MASNYPGSLDSFDTIASDKKTSDTVGGRTHRQMHNDLGDAIEAVQAELLELRYQVLVVLAQVQIFLNLVVLALLPQVLEFMKQLLS